MSPYKVEVRGQFSYQTLASKKFRTLALSVDIFLIISLTTFSLILFRISIFPSWLSFGIYLSSFIFFWSIQKFFLGKTLGQIFWKLKNRNPFPHALFEPLYQPDRNSLRTLLNSIFISFLSLSCFSLSLYHALCTDPLWSRAQIWKIKPYSPQPETHLIVPFFYILAGWPKKFEDKSVFYSLPYEKGPPSHFVGHIVANWAIPDIKLTLEGPKTPTNPLPQSEMKACFLKSFSFRCLQAKEASLRKHLRGLHKWKLQWFVVENPLLPPEDQPQGIFLSTADTQTFYDHFILIQPSGAQQTITLERPIGARGEHAFQTTQEIIGSIRSLNELEAGRAWINQKLSTIQLDNLKQIADRITLASELAEIQGLLLSKISVDPSSFESYFHLSGTSHILSKNTLNHRDAWGLIALQNLQTSFRFAMDITPTDPKVSQMQELWLDAKKH